MILWLNIKKFNLQNFSSRFVKDLKLQRKLLKFSLKSHITLVACRFFISLSINNTLNVFLYPEAYHSLQQYNYDKVPSIINL